MRRLTLRDERGATTLIVAILVPFVFFALVALVISVGGWYSARGMDQNAADAGAIAVAKSCALSTNTCDGSAATRVVAGALNGGLANSVVLVCGHVPPGTNPPAGFIGAASADGSCPAPLPAGLGGCPDTPPPLADGSATPYIDVAVRPGSSLTTPDLFGGGATAVAACAQATIAPAGSCKACASLTISQCEWSADTAGGATFAAIHANGDYSDQSIPTYLDTISDRRVGTPDAANYPDSPPKTGNYYVNNGVLDPNDPGGSTVRSLVAGSETVIVLSTTGNGLSGVCGTGTTSAGMAGWLPPNAGLCQTAFSGSSYSGSPGSSPTNCGALFQNSYSTGQPIYLPVFQSITSTSGGGGGGGSTTQYNGTKFAAFVVTGWDMNAVAGWTGSASQASAVARDDTDLRTKPRTYCNKAGVGANGVSCVYGFFTGKLVSGSELGGGGTSPGGVNVVTLRVGP